MPKFADLGVSFFDPAFTLNPEAYLAPLYQRDDILGFHSEGKNFVFRDKEARDILFDRSFMRGNEGDDGSQHRETLYAELYPHRAKQFTYGYNTGITPNLQIKALLVRLITDAAENAHFGEADIEGSLTLPLEIFLQTVGIPYEGQDLERLYRDGYNFANSFDNNNNEVLIAEADTAIKDIWDFIEPSYRDYPKGSMIAKFVDDMYSMGLGENDIKANIAGSLIITMANTAGVLSAFLLRNVIRYPSARAMLKKSPELMHKDNTIIEFLRRDNHVKALSRHATTDCMIGGFEIVKGSNIDLFYPGINLDPNHWQSPLTLDFHRNHESKNSLVFGGSIYMCIGKKLAIAFMKHTLQGFVRYLPEGAEVVEEEIEMDGSLVVERIIKKMPIKLS